MLGAGLAGGGAARRLAQGGWLVGVGLPAIPPPSPRLALAGDARARRPLACKLAVPGGGVACVSSWEGAARRSAASSPGLVRRRHLTRWSSHS